MKDATASNWGGLTFGILFVALIICLSYVFVVLWPEGGTVTGGKFDLFWGWKLHLTADQQLLALVILGGAIGGFVNSLQHLARYVGAGNLKWRYGLSYAVQPVAGAAIALIFYIVIRAGFVNFEQVKDLNTYGYLAVSLLTGLFADQAMGKLRAVAGALFTDPSPRVNPPGGGGGAEVETPQPKPSDSPAGEMHPAAKDAGEVVEPSPETPRVALSHEAVSRKQTVLKEWVRTRSAEGKSETA